MKKKSTTNYFHISIIILCTISIILSNYLFSKQIVLNIDKQFLENEYKKIWWKDNYLILKELQKQEILSYLNKLKEEKPDFIKDLQKKAKEKTQLNKYKILSQEAFNDLKNNSYIKWNSWALITIIEFSDFECKHCIKYHKENTINKIIQKYWEKTNYIFKNFPLPKYINSQKQAQASLCVKKFEGWEKYLKFVDKIYNSTKWWWEWLDLEILPSLVEEIWWKKQDFKTCYEKDLTKQNVKNEFEQGLKMWINSVPSTLIINNETKEFVLLSEMTEFIEIEKIIKNFLD